MCPGIFLTKLQEELTDMLQSDAMSSCFAPSLLGLECHMAVVPKLFGMAAPLLNPEFPKTPSSKFKELHFAK